jgi:hypothetical protein
MRCRYGLILGFAIVVICITVAAMRSLLGPNVAAGGNSRGPVINSTNEPSLRFVRFARVSNREIAVLQFSNPTKRSVYFQGYHAQMPFYAIESKSSGVWEKCRLGWCGTGAGIHKLAAGGWFEFTVPVDQFFSSAGMFEEVRRHYDHPVRVGIGYTFKKGATGTVVWSEPFDISGTGRP